MVEIRKNLADECIDAIAHQKPHNWRGEIRSLGITTEIIKDSTFFNKRFERNNIKSAIVPNLKMKTLELDNLCNSLFSCAEIRTDPIRFYVISVYMQFSELVNLFLGNDYKLTTSGKNNNMPWC